MLSTLLLNVCVLGLWLGATAAAVLFPSTASDNSPSSQQQLFAVVGGQNCATNLTYGPQAITEAGSADGKYPYFFSTNTTSKDVPHTEWLQIVTSDGSNELFRIYWSFRTAKTLAQRFEEGGSDIISADALEGVDYRVEVAGTNEFYTSRAPWTFVLDNTNGPPFQSNDTTCCFGYGAADWGSGTGIDGTRPAQFWGIRARNDGDSSDCHLVKRFIGDDKSYPSAKAYLYYFAPSPPYVQPASAAIDGTQRLFAVLGDVCLVNLYYGPQAITEAGSADGQHHYFLSTSTPDATVAHSHWLQVVTSDGVNELFRVYWYFRTAKTLAERIEETTEVGEMVDFRVEVAGTNETHRYSARWLFAPVGRYPNSYPFPYDDFNGGVPASRFDQTTTEQGFARSQGTWGTGWASSRDFWGVRENLFGCSNGGGVVVRDGQPDRTVPSGFKSHMYYFSPTTPTATPTLTPTVSASALSDRRFELFAVLDGTHCAKNLTYGPSAVTVHGEAGGANAAYLSTNTPHKDQRHKEWLQIVTSDGVTELFRIYWTFRIARTLEEHFTVAVTQGEFVNYRVVTPDGDVHDLWAKWFFSSRAGNMTKKFSVTETTHGFSDIAGMWGAGSSRNLDGVHYFCGYIDHTNPSYELDCRYLIARDCWGFGNRYDSDIGCLNVDRNGESTGYPAMKTYMSYAVDTRLSDATPTLSPTAPPPTVVRSIAMSVEQVHCSSIFCMFVSAFSHSVFTGFFYSVSMAFRTTHT